MSSSCFFEALADAETVRPDRVWGMLDNSNNTNPDEIQQQQTTTTTTSVVSTAITQHNKRPTTSLIKHKMGLLQSKTDSDMDDVVLVEDIIGPHRPTVPPSHTHQIQPPSPLEKITHTKHPMEPTNISRGVVNPHTDTATVTHTCSQIKKLKMDSLLSDEQSSLLYAHEDSSSLCDETKDANIFNSRNVQQFPPATYQNAFQNFVESQPLPPTPTCLNATLNGGGPGQVVSKTRLLRQRQPGGNTTGVNIVPKSSSHVNRTILQQLIPEQDSVCNIEESDPAPVKRKVPASKVHTKLTLLNDHQSIGNMDRLAATPLIMAPLEDHASGQWVVRMSALPQAMICPRPGQSRGVEGCLIPPPTAVIPPSPTTLTTSSNTLINVNFINVPVTTHPTQQFTFNHKDYITHQQQQQQQQQQTATTTLIQAAQQPLLLTVAPPPMSPGSFYRTQFQFPIPLIRSQQQVPGLETQIVENKNCSKSRTNKRMLATKPFNQRTYRRHVRHEPECVTISSDEEEPTIPSSTPKPSPESQSTPNQDQPSTESINSSQSSVLPLISWDTSSASMSPTATSSEELPGNHDNDPAVKPVTLQTDPVTLPQSAASKLNVKQLMDYLCGRKVDTDQPLLIESTDVRMGSLRASPVEPIKFSNNGVYMRLGILGEDRSPQAVHIHPMDFKRVLLNKCYSPAGIFIILTQACGGRMRQLFNMGKQQYWFDPKSQAENERWLMIVPASGSISELIYMQLNFIFTRFATNLQKSDIFEVITTDRAKELLSTTTSATTTTTTTTATTTTATTTTMTATPDNASNSVAAISALCQTAGSRPNIEPPSNDPGPDVPPSSSGSTEDGSTVTARAFTEPVVMMVYPPSPYKGGITVTNEDFHCLEEGEFLNDVIIDFYLKYLMLSVLSERDRERTHVCSSFFYQRLMQKNRAVERTGIPPAQRRHERVKNWTKNTDLFSKDFIIVPINENSHWFLAIICFPGLVQSQFSSSKLVNYDNSDEDGPGPSTPKQLQSESQNAPCNTPPTPDPSTEQSEPDPSPVADPSPTPPCPTTPLPTVSTPVPSLISPVLSLSVHSRSSPIPRPLTPNPSKPLPTTPTTAPHTGAISKAPVYEDEFGVLRKPCILIFDSLKGRVKGHIVRMLREYLTMEWQCKKGTLLTYDTLSMSGHSIKVPQQDNYSDCGIFLLQYVESFFQTPLKNYLKLDSVENWFSVEHVKQNRLKIQKILNNLSKSTEPGT